MYLIVAMALSLIITIVFDLEMWAAFLVGAVCGLLAFMLKSSRSQ